MNLVEFLQDLSLKGVKLTIEDGRLRSRGSKEVLTSDVIEQLKQHKAEILQLLQERPNIFNVYPLSYGQRALWFLLQLAPLSHAYNVSFAARICSEVDITAMKKAFQALMERHPILRTNYLKGESEPIQQIHQNQELDFLQIDASTWNEDELKAKVLEADRIPFDLEKEPIMRIRWFTRSNFEHILLLTIHHIACDLWSIQLLIEELAKLYQAQLNGVEASVSPVKYSYQDYVHWQRKILSQTQGEKLCSYWEKQLADNLPVLSLLTDKQRPPVQTYNGASYKFKLSSTLTEQLKGLAQKERVTLYVMFLAVFKVLLHRYTGQEDILVGSPTSGRSQAEFTQVVGYFVDPVVIRTDISNNPSFKKFLSQVRQTVLQALTHEDYPFALLVEKLQPHRDPSYSPIFQASFALQKLQKSQVIQNLFFNEIEQDVDWGGMKLKPFEVPNQEGLFDLDLEIFEGSSSLTGIFKYNSDLFDNSTIERMATHYQNLLSAIVENPSQNVGELPLLSEAEIHQLLVEWNDTQSEYAKDKCIHQLFEQQVEKTPDAIAVVFEEEQLTYKQLNQRANQLAHYLKTLGVGPEVLVGICVERSVEMVVGLLGILKAGGAYVPLDPNYPQQRLSYMLTDSGVSILLIQQKLIDALPENTAKVICLDKYPICQDLTSNLSTKVSKVKPNNLAYIIYTSGSTGKPKGVMIEHRSLVNFIEASNIEYEITSGDRLLQFASISFDVSAEEIYTCLTCGGTLVLRTDKMISSISEFLQSCRESQLTILDLPTAYWHQLTSELVISGETLPASVRLVIMGGEPALTETLNLWRKYGENKLTQTPLLINAYGVTEATVETTRCRLSELGSSHNKNSQLPIGRPLKNAEVYILDKYMQPVPIGVPGELYIGGDGLARGYLNRPQLTSEKFIQNPFSNSKSERLYKTGDLARYLSDGNIEFLGRIDHQVKIRGFRIELGEIEAVLKSHPQIQQPVVIAKEQSNGNKRLVAFIVTSDKLLTTKEIRQFLKEKLPSYMVPNSFVILDSLPLTGNDKIDHKVLSAIDEEITPEQEYIAPRTPNEEIIANIFADVLDVKYVGIEDNFFELGGHSLLATQLISKIREAFSIDIPLRELFSSPTIAQLDQTLTQLRNTNNGLTLPSIQPRTQTEQLPLSWAQERLWFLNQLEGKSATYNMPGAFRISGNLDINALQQALSEIVQRHEALRTSFCNVNGTPIQVIDPDATIKINLVDLQQLETTQRENLIIEQAQEEATTPFDLENAPLIRCSLLQLDAREYVLLLTMHHIVSDGWSIGVLIEELSSLYQAFCAGEPSDLSELPIQYADFAVWQRQYLSGSVLEDQLNYWKQQLDGGSDLLQLPTDRPRPTVQTYQGGTQSFSLSSELTQKLQRLCRESGTTLFMTLQAAFAILLYRYSGQSDILIGSPIANRNRSEIESLIGFFVNTLVLRTRFENNPSFKELLGQVRETTLNAYENQDIPFEQIVEALQPQRSLSHSPLFQVMFVLQNAPMADLELPGVTLSLLEQQSTVSKFDLTVSISERDRGLVGSWEYNSDLFDRSTIERMVGHYQNLLSAIVENPSQKVGELPLLSEAESHQLLVEWNDTTTVYPAYKCIHQLFEEQVEKTPHAIAVVFEEEQLTYQQLNQQANQLAHYLQTLGVGPEVLVGICVERSVEMVVGLLGILKAGGAYVPLDPSYPQERLSYMLADSGVGVLLTQESLVESLPQNQAQVICLDTARKIIEQHHTDNLDVGVASGNLAYIIYTSGSTGTPKGVLLEHTNVVRLFTATQSWYHFNANDVWTNFHSIAFDFSVWEIWGALFYGGKLVIVPYYTSRDPQSFYNLLCEQNVTVLNQTPSAFRQLINLEKSDDIQSQLSLRLVIFGGEALDLLSLKPWFEQHGDRSPQLVNMYGITETAVHVTYRPLTIKDLNSSGSLIGSPIPDLQIYILDDNLQPAPIGVKGQIYVGGAGLARGYLNRKQLSEERFIPNPFNHQLESRLYQTGDLGRYLPNGDIEYLGRIDNQVKIRGFRIELGEIESVINTHPQIQQAVVIAKEQISGNKSLTAYVVVSDEVLTTKKIREFLCEKLPSYMVPNGFVTLDSLPLTANGKIDRKALSAIDEEITPEQEYIAPRTPNEEIISNIFADVLDVKNVGIEDNFFELGGHSLLATQLISKLRVVFGLEIPVRAVFESPTVDQLEQKLIQLGSSNKGLSLPPIQPRETHNEQLPLSWAQERLWFLNQLEGQSATYNIPACIGISGKLDTNALEQALSQIVRRHEVLRTSFQTVNGKPVQIIHPEATIKINLVDLQKLPDKEHQTVVIQQAQLEASTPFNLEQAPLIRCSLLQLDAREYVLLLTMHHIVSDGWSIGVLTKELSSLYQAFCAGKPSALSELPIQYADFAVWQRQYLSSCSELQT